MTDKKHDLKVVGYSFEMGGKQFTVTLDEAISLWEKLSDLLGIEVEYVKVEDSNLN